MFVQLPSYQWPHSAANAAPPPPLPQVDKQSERLACYLVEKKGLKPGMDVALFMEDSLDLLVVMVAVWKVRHFH